MRTSPRLPGPITSPTVRSLPIIVRSAIVRRPVPDQVTAPRSRHTGARAWLRRLPASPPAVTQPLGVSLLGRLVERPRHGGPTVASLEDRLGRWELEIRERYVVRVCGHPDVRLID